MSLTGTYDENVYRFDGFTVEAGNFCVAKNGDPLTLTPRAFDVLCLLLKNNGRVVERSEFFDEIWKDTFVTDNALSKVVKELRHALADSADEPRYIETIPKRGYRFIGHIETPDAILKPEAGQIPSDPAVTVSEGEPKEYRHVIPLKLLAATVILIAGVTAFFLLRPAEADDSPKTLAVLPFKPLSADVRDESLEMGMADTLITRLSAAKAIIVRPTSSVRRYIGVDIDPLEAGRSLETEAVLDGSIQRDGDRIRVTARLIDVRTGVTLWAETFDGSFTDIFRVQDSMSERIASALAVKLSTPERERLAKHQTESPEAYEAYLQGQFLWNRRGPDWINQSLRSYETALEKDPNFALAHIGSAEAYIMLSGHRHISARKAEESAEPHIIRALEIDSGLAQAHNALAELKYQYKYEWEGAEREFKTAIDLNPNLAWTHQAYGWFLMSEGRFSEAESEMERARQLNPSSLTLKVARGRLYYYSRRYDTAAQHFQAALALEPTDASSYLALYNINELRRAYPEALEAYLTFRSLSNRNDLMADEFRTAFHSGGWEGFLRKQVTLVEERSAETGRWPAQFLADLYTRLGDRDKAFYWFEKVFETRDVSILQFKIEPAYDILRDDPRYAELLGRIGQKP